MPISPDILNTEKPIQERRQGILSSMGVMFIRNLESAINKIAGKTIFKVEVQNGEEEAILRKILGLMHSISASLKMGPGASPQRIAIKTTDLVTLNKSIEDILKRIETKELKVIVPQLSKVSGTVNVANLPKEYDFDKLYEALYEIKQSLSNIRLEIPPQREIKFPEIKIPEFPKSIGLAETKAIIKALNEVKDELKELPKNIPQVEIPNEVRVSNFPPQKYPLPVTHISINALAGTVKSRSVTVTTALTPLPEEVLDDRRSLVIYNNSSVTVEIGGSTFTFGEGLPVPAGTFSPAFDAGSKTIVYGRVSSGTANVRTLEISDIKIGR